MIPINKRSIGSCIILWLITFGIYSIYWEYLLVKNTRAIKKDDSSCTGEMLCLIFVPFYSLYWWFTRGKLVRDEFSKHGYSASSNETAFLVLALFGLEIVAMAIMQNDFNFLLSESTQSDQRSADKMEEVKKQRIDYIDIAKGLGMFLVIWGHIRETGISNAMAYSFHMPLFFLLSGMMYDGSKYNSFGSLVKKRIRTLLIPYAVFSVITWFVWTGYNLVFGNEVESYWKPLLETVISRGSGGYLVHNTPLWFVTCLFCVEVIYYFTNKLHTKYNVIICILLAVVGNLFILPDSPLRHLPWNLDMALCAIPFYMLGNLAVKYIGHKEINSIINKKKLLSVLFVIITVAVIYFGARLNGPVSMGHRKLNMVYVFYPLACVGISMHVALSVLLSNYNNIIIRFLKWFGKCSFYVMAVQTPIKGIVLVVIAKLLKTTTGQLSDSTPYSLLAFAITLVIVAGTVVVINTVKHLL